MRALSRLPPSHPSGASFASAGNDATVRLWTIDGREVTQLHGHENFIYSLAALPSGEIVSAGEDRTARIWRGNQCIQTITHPAISVWSVAVCHENGDVVTGASDRVVRVFSRAPDRHAGAETTSAFEEAVKGSSIPQQSVGDINKQDMPGPEFLTQKSGTKEGQVQMIRESNGNVSAYQWSTAANQWINVGTVVDSAGSSGKKISYNGKEYDYVFDVDIEDGKPPLKLPYNSTSNPYETAQKFIEDNELPISYLDQVANFIVTNTQGATLGQGSGTQAPGSDPWGTESRYRPGDAGAPASQPSAPATRPKIIPQTQYLAIASANLGAIEKKVKELNLALGDEGPSFTLSDDELATLSTITKRLQPIASGSQGTLSTSTGLDKGVDLAVKLATQWPADKRLPGLDLLRLLAAATPLTASRTSAGDQTLVDLLANADVFASDAPVNNTMLAIRTLANLFSTEEGRLIADGEFDKIHTLLSPTVETAISAGASANRNVVVAVSTLYINYAVLLLQSAPDHDSDRALDLMSELVRLTGTVTDAEALYRVLVAVGTLLALGQDFRDAAREVFEIDAGLAKAEAQAKEPRIKNVIKEVKDELTSKA